MAFERLFEFEPPDFEPPGDMEYEPLNAPPGPMDDEGLESITALLSEEPDEKQAPAKLNEVYEELMQDRNAAFDEEDIRRLLTAAMPLIRRVCRDKCSSYSDAIEASQQTLIEVNKALRRQSATEQHSFAGLVTTIAVRRSIDHYRRKSGRQRFELKGDIREFEQAPVTDTTALPEIAQAENDSMRRIGELLTKLEITPRQREMLELTVLGGLSTAEVAELFHISPGAVRQGTHKALTRQGRNSRRRVTARAAD